MAVAAAGCCRTAALKEEVEAEELKYGADFGFRSSEKNKLDNVPSDPLSKYGHLWADRRAGRQTRRQPPQQQQQHHVHASNHAWASARR